MEPSKGAHAVFVIACLLSSMGFASNEAFTEPDAIRLFLETSPQAREVPLAVRAVDAESRVDTRVSNPSVTYQIEDAAGVREEFLLFQQELPVTGRRGLLRERATVASSAAKFAAERALQTDAYALKLAFYEVLFRESALDTLRKGAEKLEGTVEILRDRERQGEGSGYDLLRAEQELAELQIGATRAEAALSAARSGFGAFFDTERHMESATLSGDFGMSDPAPGATEAIDLALSNRSDLRAASMGTARQVLEYRAARRRRFPEPTITAGWKHLAAADVSDTGYFAAVMVPLPVSAHGKYRSARATADLERSELRVEILERQIRAEVRAAVARFDAARKSALRYGGEVEDRAGELRGIAQLSYDEGESGILELLDAHRTALAMNLRAGTARYEAKTAEIELNRAIGIEVKP